jgi:type IV secretion system protein VirB9
MHPCSLTFAAAWLIAMSSASYALADAPDPRMKEVWFDPHTVVTVPVKRGVITHIALDPGEAIVEMASGVGADCAKPESSWCIAAQPGDRNIFVKPKSTATGANNLAVVTDRRTYAFRFDVLADSDPKQPVYRLVVKAPAVATASRQVAVSPAMSALPAEVPPPSSAEVIADRLQAAPAVLNSNYAIAEGKGSDDILPTLVFDDGRFTYFRFPNNREVPAVFQVQGDDSEALVNARMEGDLLVADRVSRRLMLRAGAAVVEVWNEAFDIDGKPPLHGTTVPGVERVIKGQRDTSALDSDAGSEP